MILKTKDGFNSLKNKFLQLKGKILCLQAYLKKEMAALLIKQVVLKWEDFKFHQTQWDGEELNIRWISLLMLMDHPKID